MSHGKRAFLERFKEVMSAAGWADGADVEKDTQILKSPRDWLNTEKPTMPRISTLRAIEHLTGYRAEWILHGELPKKHAQFAVTPEEQAFLERWRKLSPGARDLVERLAARLLGVESTAPDPPQVKSVAKTG